MSTLSEKELLLLSNYLYLDKCTEYSTINDLLDSCRAENGWIDENKVAALGVGGGMTVTECRKLLHEMDMASDEFKDMRVSRTIDEPELRAICFEDCKVQGDATVVFRGTGGTYKAWDDNVRGQYMADTDIQKMADDFVRYDCGIYDSLTVSGHSKGGNMAGYTAITNRDRVTRCVAFDPQGYGAEFIKNHKDMVRDSSYNIKVVSADNDPVNTLLAQVAKERVFVKNSEKGLVGRHGSFALLKACEFDEEGNIANAVNEREPMMELLHRVSLTATAMMGMLPRDGNAKVTGLLASIAASVLSDDMSPEYEKEHIKESVSALGQYGLKLCGITPDKNAKDMVITDSLYADTNGMKEAAIKLYDMKKGLDEVRKRTAAIRSALKYKAASRFVVESKLKKLEEGLEGKTLMVDSYRIVLEDITKMIETCENDITGLMGSGIGQPSS